MPRRHPKTGSNHLHRTNSPEAGRIIGLDIHPDIFTVTILAGETNPQARIISRHSDIEIASLSSWARSHLRMQDLIVLEAGSNSFEAVERLEKAGFRALVLESQQVGKVADSYLDNDLIASERIARSYLTGMSKVVWVADETTRQRRELLHLYLKSKEHETRCINELRSYLNQYHVRLKKRAIRNEKTHQWILTQHEWNRTQQMLIEGLIEQLNHAVTLSERWERSIHEEVARSPEMQSCLRIVGIGLINAFAIVATAGDIRRFSSPGKLICYLGLNPGQRHSGKGKRVQLGIGLRGRKEMRNLLVQAAQCVMRQKNGELRDWGWRLFARKGNRNIAVAAVARKLAGQLWHLLQGHGITREEQRKPLQSKLIRFCRKLRSALKEELQLPTKTSECAKAIEQRIDNFTPQFA